MPTKYISKGRGCKVYESGSIRLCKEALHFTQMKEIEQISLGEKDYLLSSQK